MRGARALWWAIAFAMLPLAHLRTQEFRALWVDAFGAGFRNSSEVSALINSARSANFNAVVVEIRKRGDAYYNGNFEPKAMDVSPQSFDPLQDLITKAHDTNAGARIEVHTWIVTYNIWNNQSTLPAQPTHPYRLHPDWLTQTQTGVQWDGSNFAFDPGHPEVARHTFNVAMDIISNYDVDGFNFDYIRYAGTEWGYNPVSVARFNARYGRTGTPANTDSQWLQFRRDQVTALVRKVYLSTMAIKPHVKISADTITWGTTGVATDAQWPGSAAYSTVLQDWRSWMQEGILDINIPMNYYRQHLHASAYTNWSLFAKGHRYNRHVVIGPGIYLNGASNAIVQMRHALKPNPNGNPSDGVCGYSYRVTNTGDVTRATFFNALTQPSILDPVTPPIFAQPATPPEMAWKTTPTRGHIKGYVYHDTNVVDGATVTFYLGTNKIVATDPTGFFGAVDLLPGNYSFTVTTTNLGSSSNTFAIVAGAVTNVEVHLPANDNVPPQLLEVGHRDISDSSARITWRTDEPADSVVAFGTSVAYDRAITNAALVTSHAFDLTGLAASTTYQYQIRSRDAAGNIAVSTGFAFTTNPEGTVSDIVIDNTEATAVGSWTVALTSTDKYGTDYHYTGRGAGGDWLQFTPRILTAGDYEVYEWHPAGSNRTTNAPHIIKWSAGTQTNFVDQKPVAGGGRWNLLGTFHFGTGTNGHVRITDGFADAGQVVLADAIKFVYAPPLVAPTIIIQPQNQTVKIGKTAAFTVQAQGTAPLVYQWYLDGTALPGATASNYSRANVTHVDAGAYWVVVSNGVGTATSANAMLTVAPRSLARIDLITMLPDGRVHLLMSGDPEFLYAIDFTTNFSNWTGLATLIATNATFEYVDPAAARRAGYYRLREE